MDYLIDSDRQEKRFKIRSLLVSGDHYEVALVEDTHEDDRVLCAKTIAYDYDRVDDLDYVRGRHQALKDEFEFLKLPIEDLSKPVAWVNVESEDTDLETEPVLVLEYIQGRTLEQIIEVEGPADPERARIIAEDLTKFLIQVHQNGYVFRDLHPSHVIVAADGDLSIVGSGNATKIAKPPNPHKKIEVQGYLAPEIRDEVGGSTLQPAADLYSLGALLSFILTGEHPRTSIENPLTESAYEQLSNLKPEGLALIVAKCMAPMAKNRLASAEELLPYLDRENLPTPTTPGFGMVLLPAPWSGAEHPETNRALKSKLSAGPLISVPSSIGSNVVQKNPDAETDAPPSILSLLFVVILVIALIVVAIALFLP